VVSFSTGYGIPISLENLTLDKGGLLELSEKPYALFARTNYSLKLFETIAVKKYVGRP